MARKLRVYELARQLEVESKILVSKLEDLKIIVTHQSVLTDAQVKKAKDTFNTSNSKKVVVRRRKKVVPVKSPLSDEDEKSNLENTLLSDGNLKPIDSEVNKSFHSKKSDSINSEDVAESKAASKVITSSDNENKNDEIVENSNEAAVSKEPEKKKELKLEDDSPPSQLPPQEQIDALKTIFDAPRVFKQPMPKVDDNLKENTAATAKAIDKGGLNKLATTSKPSRFSAIVVRRATPEDTAATNKAVNWGKKPDKIKDGDSRNSTIDSKPSPSSPSSFKKNLPGSARSGFSRGGESTSEPKKKSSQAPTKRHSLSTKSLIANFGSSDADQWSIKSASSGAIPKGRRSVYTPSRTQRLRDLKKRKDLKQTKITLSRQAYRVVKMASSEIIVSDLAKQLSIKVSELIKKLLDQKIAVTANQTVDFDTASLIADEYNYEIKSVEVTLDDILGLEKYSDLARESRPPIVAVMGHVDHGKTTLLDVIRKSGVVKEEAGGITQHIGAYSVNHKGSKIAFLDTPGHEAFSSMRARGAKLTDIVILVVAADDGVKPQTIEAIEHSKKAGVPIVVALNKVDKPDINKEHVYTELSKHDVLPEDWGGDVQCVEVSAKNKEGIESLLEAIKLQTEILELQARHKGPAEGVVVEANMTRGRGATATIMVTKGTLNLGDFILAGTCFGRVRSLVDHNGKKLKSALPSTPVKITGLTKVPGAGDLLYVTKDEKTARQASDHLTRNLSNNIDVRPSISLEYLNEKASQNSLPEISLIIKADTQGSVGAIAQSIGCIGSKKVSVNIIKKGVGDINAGDVNLAYTSKATLICFNSDTNREAKELANDKGIVIKSFKIIYELIDLVKELMVAQLPSIKNEVFQGRAKILDTINVPKVGVIAGSKVIDGKILRSSNLRVLSENENEVLFTGKISSLRRFKDDVKEVQNGFECGIAVDGYNDLKVGDLIEAYEIKESAAVLDV